MELLAFKMKAGDSPPLLRLRSKKIQEFSRQTQLASAKQLSAIKSREAKENFQDYGLVFAHLRTLPAVNSQNSRGLRPKY